MTIKSKTFTVNFVDCGRYGHYLPGPLVDRFLRQDKLVAALRNASTELSEYRITRQQMAPLLHAALTRVPPEYQDVNVPPSMDQRLGFSKYGVLQRIAQDFSGTGSISAQLEVLKTIVKELDSELSFFLIGAARAPDEHTERANRLYEQAEAISNQHRASKGVHRF